MTITSEAIAGFTCRAAGLSGRIEGSRIGGGSCQGIRVVAEGANRAIYV